MTIGGMRPGRRMTMWPVPRPGLWIVARWTLRPAEKCAPPDEKWPPPPIMPRAYTALEPRVTLAAATLAAAARVRISLRDMVVLRGFFAQGRLRGRWLLVERPGERFTGARMIRARAASARLRASGDPAL